MDAGPGLIVMVVALACALIGAIKARVNLTVPTQDGPVEVAVSTGGTLEVREVRGETKKSSRECKLFPDLLVYLGRSSVFCLLNSNGGVDVESLSWSVVPEAIRVQAVRGAAGSRLSGSIGEWNVTYKRFDLDEPLGPILCVVSFTAWPSSHIEAIAGAATRPTAR
jgi:hypothetical protein